MKKVIMTFVVVLLAATLHAQERQVENRPYIDLRPFHFGVLVGTHFQDIEFQNVGPQIITNEDGTTSEKLITTDQDRWDLGFSVGVLGELRLSSHFALRVAPTMNFGNKHITYINHTDLLENGTPVIMHQDMKSIYVSSDVNLLFSAKRFNNHRPYMLLGLNPLLNLSGKDSDIISLKRYDVLLELGMGCDFYLPFFKLRSELKFGLGLINNIDADHANHIKDKNLPIYTNSVNSAKSKFVSLTFYFE